ncbi:MAG TPA: hypothetical protein VK454_00775 [Myxococcaceae bacterium]|nr:hypothetical protein [Myxococcaceae bacterium]
MNTKLIPALGSALVLSAGLVLAQEAAPECRKPSCDEKDAECGRVFSEYRACTSRAPGVAVQGPYVNGGPKGAAADHQKTEPARENPAPVSRTPVSVAGARAALPSGAGSSAGAAGSLSAGHAPTRSAASTAAVRK